MGISANYMPTFKSFTEVQHLIPSICTSVSCLRADGTQTEWVDPEDLTSTHKVEMRKDGVTPIVRRAQAGRPKGKGQTKKVLNKAAAAANNAKIQKDPLYTTSLSDPGSMSMLDLLVQEMAYNVSLMRRASEQTSDPEMLMLIASKRDSALRGMHAALLKRKDQMDSKKSTNVDVTTPGWTTGIGYVLDTVRKTMVSANMSPESIDNIFAEISNRMSPAEWVVNLKNAVKRAESSGGDE